MDSLLVSVLVALLSVAVLESVALEVSDSVESIGSSSVDDWPVPELLCSSVEEAEVISVEESVDDDGPSVDDDSSVEDGPSVEDDSLVEDDGSWVDDISLEDDSCEDEGPSVDDDGSSVEDSVEEEASADDDGAVDDSLEEASVEESVDDDGPSVDDDSWVEDVSLDEDGSGVDEDGSWVEDTSLDEDDSWVDEVSLVSEADTEVALLDDCSLVELERLEDDSSVPGDGGTYLQLHEAGTALFGTGPLYLTEPNKVVGRPAPSSVTISNKLES